MRHEIILFAEAVDDFQRLKSDVPASARGQGPNRRGNTTGQSHGVRGGSTAPFPLRDAITTGAEDRGEAAARRHRAVGDDNHLAVSLQNQFCRVAVQSVVLSAGGTISS
jgi:hypothetical protein